jgi:putative transposase
MSRTVNGERLFDDVAKEVLRKQMWQIADYCGVQVVTYAIMSNHFHVLLRVPKLENPSDQELLRRYGVLYPKPTRYQTAKLEVIKDQLRKGGKDADAWRTKQLALMGDVSPFMKLLKQRFSVWFNRSHQRYGTLWSERFKSVLVEAKSGVMRTMAAYIDLNAVRSGDVSDPKDYRFCGYGEAVAGGAAARSGLTWLLDAPSQANWQRAQSSYRQTLFGKGSAPKENKRRLSAMDLKRVVSSQGKLPLSTVLLCRIRYFSDGAVLGSKEYVQAQLQGYRAKTGRRERTKPRPLLPITEWGDLTTLRGLRRSPFG